MRSSSGSSASSREWFLPSSPPPPPSCCAPAAPVRNQLRLRQGKPIFTTALSPYLTAAAYAAPTSLATEELFPLIGGKA